jgi:hypothetical protein
MNFLEGADPSSKGGKLRSLTVVKFADSLRFYIDGESVKDEMRARFNAIDAAAVFKISGSFTEISSGVTTQDTFLLMFKGFFRQSVEGRILLPSGILAKDYDRYSKAKPYLLSFLYDDLQLNSPND